MSVESTRFIAHRVLALRTEAEMLKAQGVPPSDPRMLDAQEIVRRWERELGLAIRMDQDAGLIETPEQARVRANVTREVKAGRQPQSALDAVSMPRPTDFASAHELSNSKGGIYDLAAVTGEQFEDAIAAARSERNMSRTNVVRKIRGITSPATRATRADMIEVLAAQGYSSRQMAEKVGVTDAKVREIAKINGIEIPADHSVYRSRHHDSNRIVAETASALEGLAMGVDLVDVDTLDRADLPHWLASIKQSLSTLNKFRNTLERK